jgi:hypothetical protein
MTNIAPVVSFDPDNDACDRLLGCMIDAYRQCRAHERENPSQHSEQKRRELALVGIQECLEWHPLESFQAETLEFFGLLFGYWRVAELEAGGAPEPDALQ